nr:MAG TPA: hypothetical protein [Caudoviricetes sp.]
MTTLLTTVCVSKRSRARRKKNEETIEKSRFS